MTSLQETTTVIIIRDSDPLLIETRILNQDSVYFREYPLEEHDLSDFDPAAVRVFLTLLKDGKMKEVEPRLFREIHKMAVTFEVPWLREDCKRWITEKINTSENIEELTFCFEECYYVLTRLQKRKDIKDKMAEFMTLFTDQLGTSEKSKLLINNYLDNFENLETDMIYPLLQLGGSNSDVFLKVLKENVAKSSCLSKNALHLLMNINLKVAFKSDLEQWTELFDAIAKLPKVKKSDLKVTQPLITEAWRLSNTDITDGLNTVPQKILYGIEESRILQKCKTLSDIVAAVAEGTACSMSDVVLDSLVRVLSNYIPNTQELNEFFSDMERLCAEKRIARVPWQIIDQIIPLFEFCSKSKDYVKSVISILNTIRQSKVLSSTKRENIIIPCHKPKELKFQSNEWHLYHWMFKFKHPATGSCSMPGECGFIIKEALDDKDRNTSYDYELAMSDEDYVDTGVHYHHIIRVRDIYFYEVFKFLLPDGSTLDTPMGTQRWWEFWHPKPKKIWLNTRHCVAYSVSNYMVAK